ncbi:collagenase [Streptacidiphilus sp. MAP5-3]|uniref:collagenase n=1 Tax=unclassified Streptacidiphilus TaxID=2643834 RepID=UPI003516F0AF
MRHHFPLPGLLALVLAAGTAVAGLLAPPAVAAGADGTVTGTAGRTAATSPVATAGPDRPLPPTGTRTSGAGDQAAVQTGRLTAAQLPPYSPPTSPTTFPTGTRPSSGQGSTASCTPADFGGRSGTALVSFVESATTDCLNTLFGVTGPEAGAIFRENQMVSVADAFTTASASYAGDDATGIWQLVLFLRAGYYVQYNDSADVGGYGAALTSAVAAGIDAFTASAHFTDVSDANGQVAGDVVTLTDSAGLQARYLGLYQRVLNGYSAAYNASPYMVDFVNDVFTPLYRGHQFPDFVAAVTTDPSVVSTLDAFTVRHTDLLGTADAFLDANAGVETARFLQHQALQALVRPLVKGLLAASSITGRTAPLWVGVANLAASEDPTQCGYYGVCDLPRQLTLAALPVTHTCDATHTVQAQALTPADLAAVCASLRGQDPFFQKLVEERQPLPHQHESTVTMVVFASPTDYQTYAGALFGVDTDNGGITLTGDPTDPKNRPLSIVYQKPTDDGFAARIWNLNHEYTHDLDGRYDMLGDFTAETAVPDVWWIEGVAEYVSYTYRGVTDTEAVAEAAKHTYALSTLFQNTYENSDVTRTYPWGYLAVRYMVENHPAVVQQMLARFRVGDYQGGYAIYHSPGTRYDADFDRWLDACAAGACAGAGSPTAAFRVSTAGLTLRLADRSTDVGKARITSHAWDFGDGTGSTAATPAKTYAAPGSYLVTLTVTDTNGRTSTASQRVTVAAPRCAGPDPRLLGRDCSRSGESAHADGLVQLHLYLPAGRTTLTVSTAGGSGTAYLYYDPRAWASPALHTASSTRTGTTQSLAVTNTAPGWRYISLYGHTSFSGVTVTAEF